MDDRPIVYIVDDDAAVRRSAAFMLGHAGYKVETFETGPAFLRQADHTSHGCVLLDIRMPEMDGMQVHEAMKENGVTMPVIILTGHGEVDLAVRAMRAGAINFLEKPYEKSELIAAIEEAMERDSKDDLRDIAASEAVVRLACLTGRERDVLNGLMKGHPNKTIAYDLGISPRTIEIYRANMMDKLHVRSLAEALRIGFAAEEAE